MENTKLVDKETIEKTRQALSQKGYEVFVFESGVAALSQIKKIIPNGASVMNGSSVTLEQIGYIDYLKEGHGLVNLHEVVASESDPIKRKVLRRQAVLSDYYLGSVHALLENGEFLVASNTGSQLPHIVYTSTNLIFVVSTKKIVKNYDEAMTRLTEHVFPLEDKHSKEKYGEGTHLNKLVVFKGESASSGRKITFILVNEDLGF